MVFGKMERHERLDIINPSAIRSIIHMLYERYTPSRKDKYKPYAEWADDDKEILATILHYVEYDKEYVSKVYHKIETFNNFVLEEYKGMSLPQKPSYERIKKARKKALANVLSKRHRNFPLLHRDDSSIIKLYSDWVRLLEEDERRERLIRRELLVRYIHSPKFAKKIDALKFSLPRDSEEVANALQQYTKITTQRAPKTIQQTTHIGKQLTIAFEQEPKEESDAAESDEST